MVVLIIDSRMTDPFLRTEACFVVTLFLSWLGDDCWIGLRCSALNPLYELFHTILPHRNYPWNNSLCQSSNGLNLMNYQFDPTTEAIMSK